MKKLLIVLFSTLILLACKKEEGSILNNRFKGIWEFENYFGYPFNNNYLPPGNGRIIVLFENGNFERRQHDTILFKGRYFLKVQKTAMKKKRKYIFQRMRQRIHGMLTLMLILPANLS